MAEPMVDWHLTSLRVAALINAMDQLLDEMRDDGLCVSLLAKAKARIAFEPFLVPDFYAECLMSLAEAERIVEEEG